MKNTKPKLALAAGIVCISIFPILVRLKLTPGLISAFYRMFFSFVLLMPFVVFSGKFKKTTFDSMLLSLLCGLIFASDVAVWNISIQESSATQATLLTNLSPVWVGVGSFLFLANKPKRNFWIGTTVALIGMAIFVGLDFFAELRFDRAFFFAVLSGILYAFYMLISKSVLRNTEVLTFMTLSLFASSVFLAIVCYCLNEPFSGFSTAGWLVLAMEALICQLAAWLLISFATQHMKATRVSLSLLGQAIFTAFLAWIFLDEKITFRMLLGGCVLLIGIRITFVQKAFSLGFLNLGRKK